MTDEFRSAWADPNVMAALKEGRQPNGIAVMCCGGCGNYGYYNEGSHFSCSVEGCEWSCSGEALEALIDNGEVMMLADLADESPDPFE